MLTWARQHWRRWLTGYPTVRTPEDHNAWLHEQVRAYATPQPYAGPLSTGGADNPTGETWEIRQGYRKFAFKEPSVKGALLTKMLAVAQLEATVTPYSKSDKRDRQIAQWVKWALKNTAGGVPALTYKIGIHSLIEGFGVTEKVIGQVQRNMPDYGGYLYVKAGKAKDVNGIRFKLDTYKNIVSVRSMIAAQGGANFNPDDFIIFTHLPFYESPFGISDLRAANRAANLIEAAIKLRSILLENFSGPYLIGKSSDPTVRGKIAQTLKEARARGWIVIDEEAEVQVINLATSAPDQFQNTIEDLRREIVTAIQGAYLNLLEGGVADGRGNTQVHQTVSQLFQWWLATCISAAINQSVVPDLVYPNYGYDVGLPTVTLGGIDAATVAAELDRFSKGQSLGLTLSKKQICEVGNFETPDPDDPSDALPPPQQQGQGGAGGGANPFGGGLDLFGPNSSTPPDQTPPDNSPGAIDAQKGGGSGNDATSTFRDDGGNVVTVDGVSVFSQEQYDAMELADRSHLVKKVIQDKNGNHRVVYVNPNSGEHGTEQERLKPRTDAEAYVTAALANPGKLTGEQRAQLVSHLKTLTKEKKQELARKLRLHVSDSKQHLVDRLLAYAQGEKQPKRPEGPDTLYKVVKRFGGLDPKSLAFLAHYKGVGEAMQNGISLGFFKTGGRGLDQLAKELHTTGYISSPDPEHLIDQMRKGAKAAFNQTQESHDKALHEYDLAQEEAYKYEKEHGTAEDRKRLAEANARAQAYFDKMKAQHKNPEEDFVPFDDATPTAGAPTPIDKLEQAAALVVETGKDVEEAKTFGRIAETLGRALDESKSGKTK